MYLHTVILKFLILLLIIRTFAHGSPFASSSSVRFFLHLLHPRFLQIIRQKLLQKCSRFAKNKIFGGLNGVFGEKNLFLARKTCFWHIILCFWHFFAKFRVSHFAKNRLLQKYYVVAELIFPVCRF